MLRLLLIAGLLLGLGICLQRGWLEIRWDRLGHDLQRQINPADGGSKNPPR